jgi:hypothetical protein
MDERIFDIIALEILYPVAPDASIVAVFFPLETVAPRLPSKMSSVALTSDSSGQLFIVQASSHKSVAVSIGNALFFAP